METEPVIRLLSGNQRIDPPLCKAETIGWTARVIGPQLYSLHEKLARLDGLYLERQSMEWGLIKKVQLITWFLVVPPFSLEVYFKNMVVCILALQNQGQQFSSRKGHFHE